MSFFSGLRNVFQPIEKIARPFIQAAIPQQFQPLASQSASFLRSSFAGGNDAPVSAGVPALMTDTGVMVPTGGGAIGAITTIAAQAIFKLATRLGIPLRATMTSVLARGRTIWASINAFAVRNPGTSVLALLVGLGLTAEEAAHFIAWGATHKRRRRRRGISARDLTTTRRTIRKVVRISHDLRQLAGAQHHFARRPIGRSTTLVRQG